MAHADLDAYTTVLSPAGDKDIAMADTATHTLARLTSSAINTGTDESEPALSADGTLLAYMRGPVGQPQSVMVTNLSTGATASVVDSFDLAALRPTGPAWTASGHLLLGINSDVENGVSTDRLLDVDLTNFPSGPFPRVPRVLGPAGVGAVRTSSVAEVTPAGASAPVDVAVELNLTRDQIVTMRTTAPGNTGHFEQHPTISAADGVVVYMSATSSSGPSKLAFTDLGSPGVLPSIVNASGADEQMPAFSPDGRYLAFIRAANGKRTLLVFDTSTQMLLDTTGVTLDPPATSGLSAQRSLDGLDVRPGAAIFSATTISKLGVSAAVVRVHLVVPSLVGIIVQKVVGHTKLLGRTVSKLRFVGRVPLGSFRKGASKVQWNLRVAGRPLAPGRYQVTPRSLTASGGIRDLGKPVLITIPAHAHH